MRMKKQKKKEEEEEEEKKKRVGEPYTDGSSSNGKLGGDYPSMDNA